MVSAPWALALNDSAFVEVVFVLLWRGLRCRWWSLFSLHELFLFFNLSALNELVLRFAAFANNDRRRITPLFTNNDRCRSRRRPLADDNRLRLRRRLSIVIGLFHISLYLVVIVMVMPTPLRRREVALALKAELAHPILRWGIWRPGNLAISLGIAIVGLVAAAMVTACHRSAVIVIISI
jgi:hypothetical protein